VLQLTGPKGDERRLNLPARAYVNPRLAPDGDRFAVEVVGDDGKSQLSVHSLSGDIQPRLIAQEATSPVWLPANRLVFNGTREGVSGVFLFDLDGAKAPELLLEGTVASPWVPNDVSPDGKTLLLMRGGPPWGIFSFSMERRGEPQRIPHTETGFAGGAQFSPDGRWFAYQRADELGATGLTMAVRVQRYPPEGPEYLISPGGRTFPVWRAGNELVYQAGLFSQSMRLAAVTVRPGDPFAPEKEREMPVFVTGHRLQRNFDIDASRRMLAAVPTEEGPAQLNVVIHWFDELKARIP